jgi:hypothetical protein
MPNGQQGAQGKLDAVQNLPDTAPAGFRHGIDLFAQGRARMADHRKCSLRTSATTSARFRKELRHIFK